MGDCFGKKEGKPEGPHVTLVRSEEKDSFKRENPRERAYLLIRGKRHVSHLLFLGVRMWGGKRRGFPGTNPGGLEGV